MRDFTQFFSVNQKLEYNDQNLKSFERHYFFQIFDMLKVSAFIFLIKKPHVYPVYQTLDLVSQVFI